MTAEGTMQSIPMSVDGLEEQYHQFQQVEDRLRLDLNALRREVSQASKNRLRAYKAWQRALDEQKRGLRS